MVSNLSEIDSISDFKKFVFSLSDGSNQLVLFRSVCGYLKSFIVWRLESDLCYSTFGYNGLDEDFYDVEDKERWKFPFHDMFLSYNRDSRKCLRNIKCNYKVYVIDRHNKEHEKLINSINLDKLIIEEDFLELADAIMNKKDNTSSKQTIKEVKSGKMNNQKVKQITETAITTTKDFTSETAKLTAVKTATKVVENQGKVLIKSTFGKELKGPALIVFNAFCFLIVAAIMHYVFKRNDVGQMCKQYFMNICSDNASNAVVQGYQEVYDALKPLAQRD